MAMPESLPLGTKERLTWHGPTLTRLVVTMATQGDPQQALKIGSAEDLDNFPSPFFCS